MSRKKIVFVIVEGPSDDTALGIMLNRIYDKNKVYVQIMHGDITTRTGVRSDNIVAKIGDEVRQYAADNHYKQSDFKQIIHIVDTDGAYIPTENVILDLEQDKTAYESDGIYTSDRQKIIKRNQQKTENLYRLRGTGKIWKIPYRNFSVNGDYKDSWKHIEKGLNSIKRCTNFGICIMDERLRGI